MKLSASELLTIRRALIAYQIQIPSFLRIKGFDINLESLADDIVNINVLLSKIDQVGGLICQN